MESRRSFNRLLIGGTTKRKRNSSSSAQQFAVDKRQKGEGEAGQNATTEDGTSIFTLVKEEECPICSEKMEKDFLFLPCGHVTHFFCLAKWLDEKDTLICPICRGVAAQLLPKKLTNGYIGQTNEYGRPHGKGTITWKGIRFEGEFQDSAFKKGTMTWNGNRYEGEFQDFKQHGKGTMTYSDGARFEGEWQDNKFQKGTVTYPNGNHTYDGEWQNNSAHGKGTATYSNGKYKGEFQDGKHHGTGTMTYSNGNRYDGEWQNNALQGTGTMTYSNGDRYEGEWQDGKQHGTGTMTYSNGDRWEGEWQDNIFKKGTITLSNGEMMDYEKGSR